MRFAASKFYCFGKIDVGEICGTCVIWGKGEVQCYIGERSGTVLYRGKERDSVI